MLIFFTGFMGAGKTTIGKQVAQLLKVSFLDLDEEIERLEGKTITQLFSENGEDYFRIAERNVLLNIIKTTKTTAVLALGGGTSCFMSNHTIILQNGISVYLKKSWEDTEIDLKHLQNRPLIRHTNLEEIKKIFLQREPIYALSQLETLVNASFSPQKLANKLKLLTNR